ncbi:MOSC domain-containing protein [Thiofilum flexile]|uniref:MOSC domain-containing protein n=1 Tax=Thiofilum flexile TaxID=125627 RepID=UPI0003720B4D|nr:MOSC domain-containing protein [Thiofilum flexile]
MTGYLLGRVESVLTGKSRPYTRAGTYSAIDKQVLKAPVHVSVVGLEGDEQGDLRVHGGVDKAVHFYALEHYPFWIEALGRPPVLEKAGAFGENLCTTGVTETSICLADQLRIGNVLLEVSQARQPCWKLNDRFGQPDMARRVQHSLRTGWYCRVLEAGVLQAGDAIELVQRPYPVWTLARMLEILYHRSLDYPMLEQMLELPLVESWRRMIENRLKRGEIEDWNSRINGSAFVSKKE